jgi:PAS domain S-box-containing protein
VPVAVTAVSISDEASRRIGRSCVMEDLSALQALQRQLLAQQELLAHIGRSAADAIIGVDREGRVTSWNAAAEQLVGRTAQSAIGERLAILIGDPGLEALLMEVRELGSGRIARAEWHDLRGQPIPVEVSAAALTDASGDHGGIALVARDVSARQRLDRQLMRSEKLAVTGSLAAGLAHEIGTPLNVISATAEYLMLDAASEPTRERLRGIVAETDRISRLVRELLTFARGGTHKGREDVDLVEALDRVRSLVSIPLERKHVELHDELARNLPRVRVDRDGMHQVLLNLILNAVAAVADGGRVGVRASESGTMISLEVHDDGPGVAPALRERIFDPFFTTRAEGTGLGLAVCARVISEHGGDVRVGEGPLGGASFIVQLPVAEATP